MLSQIGAVDYILICAAFFVAFVGIWSRYKIIPAILLAEFCIVIGFETYVASKGFGSLEEVSSYYYVLTTIELGMFMLYMGFKSRFQTMLTFICVIYLTSINLLTKNGIIAIPNSEFVNYEVDIIFATLFVAKLFIAMIGVLNGYGLLNGYRHYHDGFRNHSSGRSH